jgi:DNA-binding MarR family transcriptional regulator
MEFDESTKFFVAEDEDEDLWLLLTHARYALFRAREKELQRYGISPEQAGLLFAVRAMGIKATPAALSRHLLRQPHTVSALINRMAKRGLIRKVRDFDHKNWVRVEITEKRQKAYEQSTKRGPIHRVIGSLDSEEKKAFRQNLEKIFTKARQEIGMGQDPFPSSEA